MTFFIMSGKLAMFIELCVDLLYLVSCVVSAQVAWSRLFDRSELSTLIMHAYCVLEYSFSVQG